MSIFKCKMCGGDLKISDESKIVECEYCGTTQTVPNGDDEKKINLFNRANRLRMENEFDKAAGVYESIVSEYPEESEGYWGLVLCAFGIEYVDDAETGKKIPTCHRTVTSSVMDDDNFAQACENADTSARVVYREEAKEIDRLQKKIISVVEGEEPYDVFICYKETDDVTRVRTEDSLIAQDIYTELVKEGYKVFFSRVTLREKAGTEYEPYIYAALKSSKVMLAIGTKYEYYDAVWVKNEWGRYITMMVEDKEKHLIPCFKNLDAYDIPKEFKNLQALDMGEVTFFKNLAENIARFVPKKAEKGASVSGGATAVSASATEPLLKRAFMFLEDGDWNSANEYCEKVLDIDPECAEAYLGKLMAELHVRSRENLQNCAQPFDASNNYQKALRFSDEALKNYIELINTRNENARLDNIYTRAKNAMSVANTESAYKAAAQLFESIDEYRDSAALAQSCYEKAETARKDAERKAKRNKKIAIITTLIVCAIIAFIIILNTVIIPNVKYSDAIALMDAEKLDEAYSIFIELGEYKDATDKARDIKLIKTKEQVKNAKTGDYIKFGAYEQDNDISNGKETIEWLVLEVRDGKALVISKYVLDCKPYNAGREDVTWETCTLRKWLNNDFINAAFSADEKAMIPTVMVLAFKTPNNSTNPGNATQDQVFLLSITEVNKYFNSDSARQCEATDYVVANGTYVRWWLRSPGYYQTYASYVALDGDVLEGGFDVSFGSGAVRPALWIDLNS